MKDRRELTEAAAGDRWSEHMNKIQTVMNRYQLAVKKEIDSRPEKERERDDRKIESLFQIPAGLTVCTERVFQVKVNRSPAIRATIKNSVLCFHRVVREETWTQ